MSKRRSISPEDKALFRKAVKGVTPLKEDERHKTPKPRKTITTTLRKKAATHQPPLPGAWMENMGSRDWLNAEDTLHFAQNGLQHKVTQRLQRGQIQIEAQIDLHQHTIEEAIFSVTKFIDDCRNHGKRWICIIHGKGHFSKEGKPVLKNFLNQWLRKQPSVLAFHSAKPKHGGTGAVYVLLKGKRT